MTRYTPQWLQAGSYSAGQDRRLISALWPGPASTGAAATTTPGTMAVTLAAGQVAVPTQNSTWSVLCSWDAPEQVTHATLTGNNRIDLVTVWPQSSDVGSGTGDTFTINVVQGTPATTPAAPATPAGQVALYQVYVTGGAVALVAANLTDVRPGGLSLSGGAAQPPYTGSGVGSYADPAGEVWVAKSGVNGGAWRKARDVIHAEYYRGAAWTVPTAIAPIGCDVVLSDGYGMFVPGTGTFTAPIAGLYSHHFQLGAQATASQQWFQAVLTNAGGGAIAGAFMWAALAGGGTLTSNVTMLRVHAAGEQVICKNYASAAMAGVTGVDKSRYQVNYVGTG